MNKRLKPVLYITVIILVIGGIIAAFYGEQEEQSNQPVPEKMVEVLDHKEINDSIHVATGLIVDEGLNLVIAHCTGCHSAKLITQNGSTREGWVQVIRWMQQTQNLWDLGESEAAIVDYLSKNYSPQKKGRRPPLSNIEWYELKE